MLHVQNIDSFDLPDLQPYRTMRRPLEHAQQGIFVAEGEKVVRRLLQSHFFVVSALLSEKWLREFELLLQARPEDIRVYIAEKALLEQLIGFSMFQGALALGRIPEPASLDTILAQSQTPRLFVALDGLGNAENLGGLVRNCVAFNTQALIVGETSSSPFLRRAVRSSMGTIFKLPIARVSNLAHALRELGRLGIRCVAAHPRADHRNPPAADFANDCCLVLGSEGYGISAEVLAACDQAVAIPMAQGVDSLNVVNAAAVFLYEAARQRGTLNCSG